MSVRFLLVSSVERSNLIDRKHTFWLTSDVIRGHEVTAGEG